MSSCHAPRHVWGFSALLAVLCVAGCGQGPKPSERPNVVLVVFDTTRADHLSPYGYERATSPTLDALAAEGVLFETAYAPMGLTGPSHATLFTGRYPARHGVVRNGIALMGEATTLAERLADAGYRTAGFASTFVIEGKFGFDQGFTHYDDAFTDDEATMVREAWEGHALAGAFDRRADHTTDRAVTWLEAHRDVAQPFFLFVHYFDPHSPYDPPEAHAEGFMEGVAAGGLAAQKAAYDGEIHFADAQLGRLVNALDRLDLRENTLLVVTADHGEGLMQRGYMLHGLSVYDEEVRVPLVLSWPEHVPKGKRVAEPVALADVAPTVLDLVGTNGLPDPDGLSLASTITDADAVPPAERPIYLRRRHFDPGPVDAGFTRVLPDGTEERVMLQVAGEQFGMRSGRWKYVVDLRSDRAALFDIARDPNELKTYVEFEPEVVERLAPLLQNWIAGARAGQPADPEFSEADRARLRALGYVN